MYIRIFVKCSSIGYDSSCSRVLQADCACEMHLRPYTKQLVALRACFWSEERAAAWLTNPARTAGSFFCLYGMRSAECHWHALNSLGFSGWNWSHEEAQKFPFESSIKKKTESIKGNRDRCNTKLGEAQRASGALHQKFKQFRAKPWSKGFLHAKPRQYVSQTTRLRRANAALVFMIRLGAAPVLVINELSTVENLIEPHAWTRSHLSALAKMLYDNVQTGRSSSDSSST